MVKSAWYDIEMRGRRLEAVAKQVCKKFYKLLEDEDPILALTYLDRLIKIESAIKPYVEEIVGLDKFLKDHERNKTKLAVTREPTLLLDIPGKNPGS